MSTTVNSTNSTAAATQTSSLTGKTSMGKDDFLKLLLAQMKNQDPMNPMDGTQYAAQLAQFSSLEQMTNINQTLTDSLNANYAMTQSINNSMSAAMIGKEVKVNSSSLAISKDSTEINFGYTLPENAKTGILKITDSNGLLVQSISLSDLKAGDHTLKWDLKNSSGSKVAAGTYSYSIECKDYSAKKMTVDSYRFGKIAAVRFTSGGTKAVIDNSEISISDITEIMNGG